MYFNLKDYEPLFLSELEHEYPKLIELLKQRKTFIINGPESCGKLTTLIKHIEFLKFNYKIIEFDISLQYFKDNYTLKSKNVLSYLYNENNHKSNNYDIVIVKNFEKFDDKIKEFIIDNRLNNFYILITNKYINSKFNHIKFHEPSYEYLSNIYLNIYFLELQNKTKYLNEKLNEKLYKNLNIPLIYNFHQLQSYINLNLNLKNKNEVLNIEYDIFKELDINQIIQEKNFSIKVLNVSKLNSVAIINNNLAYNIDCIHDIANAYEYILESFNYYNFTISNYYEIFNSLNIIAPIQYLDKSKEFKIYLKNFYVKKKNKLNYF
jgi:hypothetical protein